MHPSYRPGPPSASWTIEFYCVHVHLHTVRPSAVLRHAPMTGIKLDTKPSLLGSLSKPMEGVASMAHTEEMTLDVGTPPANDLYVPPLAKTLLSYVDIYFRRAEKFMPR